MKGHKICFYGEIWKIIPKLFQKPLLIWITAWSISIHINKVAVQMLLSMAISAEPGSTPSKLFWPNFFLFVSV